MGSLDSHKDHSGVKLVSHKTRTCQTTIIYKGIQRSPEIDIFNIEKCKLFKL